MSTFLNTPPITPFTVDPSTIPTKPLHERPYLTPTSIVKHYEWLLFDADETLFSFDSWKGLTHMFQKFSFPFNREDYDAYQKVNIPLWDQLQRGEIDQSTLKIRRFEAWAERVNTYNREHPRDDNDNTAVKEVSPSDLNDAYEDSLAETSSILPGVVEFLDFLKFHGIKMGIVTNGFNRLQRPRLKHLGLDQGYFDLLVISENIGVAKPNPLIFEATLKLIEEKTGKPISKERVMMVGDNPDSDVRGGMNAGLDTCWINAHNKKAPVDVFPTYTVANISELHYAMHFGMEDAKRPELASPNSSDKLFYTSSEVSSTGNSLKI